MRLPNHFNPDHYLNLAEALVVTTEDVRAAWERPYAELQRHLLAVGPSATLYLAFSIQGAGKRSTRTITTHVLAAMARKSPFSRRWAVPVIFPDKALKA